MKPRPMSIRKMHLMAARSAPGCSLIKIGALLTGFLATAFLISACNRSPQESAPARASDGTVQTVLAHPAQIGVDINPEAFRERLRTRSLDPAVVVRGRELFAANCATCHGAFAEGTPDWRKRLADGTFPPPPLNGTAHTWHHPDQLLLRIMRDGGQSYGPTYQGAMPPMGKVVNAAERQAILQYLKSLWPDEAWRTQQDITRENPEEK